MKRRDFLKNTLPAGILLHSLVSGFSFKVFGASSVFAAALQMQAEQNDHILVIQRTLKYFYTRK